MIKVYQQLNADMLEDTLGRIIELCCGQMRVHHVHTAIKRVETRLNEKVIREVYEERKKACFCGDMGD
jgi:hypothetical protein